MDEWLEEALADRDLQWVCEPITGDAIWAVPGADDSSVVDDAEEI